MTSIADKLSALANEHGRLWMRRRCGIESAPFGNFLSGRKRPALETVLRISRAMGIDALWLLDDAMGMPPVRRSAAYADDDSLDDTARARLALHRAIDLLDGEALVSAVDFVGLAVKRQSQSVCKNGGEGSGRGHALKPGPSSLSTSVFGSGAPNVSPALSHGSTDGEAPAVEPSRAWARCRVEGDVHSNAASLLDVISTCEVHG